MVEINHLSNGMAVVLEPMEYLRSVSFGIWVKTGSANENTLNNGISHVIEHMLFKGTETRNARKLADDMAKLGGNLNAYTSKEYTSYYVTTLDEQLPYALELMSDMLLNSVFDKADLKKEKEIILEEIDMYEDSPEDLVHEMLQKEIWKDHPLGYIISGGKEVVRGLTREELLSFKENNYTADNMVLSLAGRFDNRRVLELLERCFGTIPREGRRETAGPVAYVPCIYRKKKDIEQIYMNIAFDCINYHSEEKYILSVVNAMLGGNDNSRLFQIIREDMGLVYSIYSYESLFSDAGLFHIDTVLNPSKLKRVFDEIMIVIENFKRDGIQEEELVCTKEQLKTELIIGSENTRNRMSSNGKSYLCRRQLTSIDEVIQGVQNVTRDDVLAFAGKYFHTDQYSMALVGNL